MTLSFLKPNLLCNTLFLALLCNKNMWWLKVFKQSTHMRNCSWRHCDWWYECSRIDTKRKNKSRRLPSHALLCARTHTYMLQTLTFFRGHVLQLGRSALVQNVHIYLHWSINTNAPLESKFFAGNSHGRINPDCTPESGFSQAVGSPPLVRI